MRSLYRSPVGYRSDPGQRLPLDELERGAPAGRDMRHPVDETRFFHGLDGLASADDRRRAAFGHELGDAASAVRESGYLAHAHPTVPAHGLRVLADACVAP